MLLRTCSMTRAGTRAGEASIQLFLKKRIPTQLLEGHDRLLGGHTCPRYLFSCKGKDLPRTAGEARPPRQTHHGRWNEHAYSIGASLDGMTAIPILHENGRNATSSASASPWSARAMACPHRRRW